MRIDGRFTGNAAAMAGQASRPTGTARFALGTQTSKEAARANSAAPLATLHTILMLQQEDPNDRKRRQARRGSDLIDGLDRLKAGLLTGTVPISELESLTRRLTSESGATGDPLLDEALACIELRVKVELAKLGRV